jgi:tight adherence protein C
MLILLLFGLVLLGFAVWLLLQAVGSRRARVVESLQDVALYGFGAPRPREDGRSSRRFTVSVDQLATTVGDFLARHTALTNEEALRRELRSAGIYDMSPRKFMGYRVLAGIVLPLGWIWLSVAAHSSLPKAILGFVVVVITGWQGPLIVVRRKARHRLEQIDYQMPELIDLLVTTVEAGVGFSGSLQLASRSLTGPLGDELRLTLQEQDMGLSTQEALTNLQERADTPTIRAFVRAITQGESLGVSIGRIMRDLALEMRKVRRQKAEERAQKAPTKMLFPLVFLLLPALFVVLLGPAVVDILHTLRGL